MRKQLPPPIPARFLEQDGQINRQWVRWFQLVGKSFEDIRRPPDVVHAADATLTTDDWGKTIVMDCRLAPRTCTMMEVTSRDVSCWLTIMKWGTYKISIVPSSTTRIESGSLGRKLWNEENKRFAANVTLQLMVVDQWAIVGSTGLWKLA